MQRLLPRSDPAAPWLWAALTMVGLAVAVFAAFGVAIIVVSRGLFPDAGPGGLRLDLGGFLLLTGAFGIGAVEVAGRVAFGRWLGVRPGHIVLAAIGAAVSIGVELALHEWAEASIGYYDADVIGWTAGLSFCVVLAAVAQFAVNVAPPGAAVTPRIGMALSATLVVLIVLSNVPGLEDGIGPSSWPLAILVGASALYAIAALVGSMRDGTAADASRPGEYG